MKKQLIMMGVAAVIMMTIFYMNQSNSSDATLQLSEYVDEELEETNVDIVEEVEAIDYYLVDVKGQVQVPGVYKVEDHLRVQDVILLAGGFLETANTEAINLAQKIRDEMVIYVPHLEEEGANVLTDVGVSSQENPKVSLNQATESELQMLPGIGPSKASAIIKYREENGKFQTVDELTNVSGIGNKTLENLRDYIEL